MLTMALTNGYGETPPCPDSTFKRGDVVAVRKLRGLEHFPAEAIVAAVVPPGFPPEFALADLVGERRPTVISQPKRTVRYILVTEDDRRPYLAGDRHLLPSGKPPVEIGSVRREGAPAEPPPPANFLGLDMPGYAGPPGADGQGLTLLPPAKGACPTCAREHPEDQPHDAASLYWHTRRTMIGWPMPTWPEAVAHCAPALQTAWLDHLRRIGVDVDAGQLRPRKEAAHG